MNRYFFRVSWLVISILLALSFASAHAYADTTLRAPLANGCTPYYVVRSGDTLSGIATRCGVSTSRLAQANALRLTSVIYPGQRLIMPGTMDSFSSAASIRNTTNTTSAGSLTATGCPVTYTVRAGDTLGAIARRCGTSVASLKQRNNLRSDMIWVGQILNTRSTGSTAISVARATPDPYTTTTSQTSPMLYAPPTSMAAWAPTPLPVVIATPTPYIVPSVSPW